MAECNMFIINEVGVIENGVMKTR